MLRLEAAERAHNTAKFTNPFSFAWRQRPELLPRPGSGSTRREPVNVGGDFLALQEAMSAQEHDSRRLVAKLRAEAAANLARARAEVGDLVTMAEWAEWFDKNSAAFAKARKAATRERRALSRRLRADRTLPRRPPAPPAAHADRRAALNPLQLLLSGRSGWHSVRLPGRLLLLFLWHQGNTTWVVDLTRVGTLRHRVVCIPYDARLSTAMQPLAHFMADAAGTATVYEIAIGAACVAESIEISFLDRQQIIEELRPPSKGSRQRPRPADSDAESGSSASCSEAGTEADLPSHRSEDSDVTREVETDLETVVEDWLVETIPGNIAFGVASSVPESGAIGRSLGHPGCYNPGARVSGLARRFVGTVVSGVATERPRRRGGSFGHRRRGGSFGAPVPARPRHVDRVPEHVAESRVQPGVRRRAH